MSPGSLFINGVPAGEITNVTITPSADNMGTAGTFGGENKWRVPAPPPVTISMKVVADEFDNLANACTVLSKTFLHYGTFLQHLRAMAEAEDKHRELVRKVSRRHRKV